MSAEIHPRLGLGRMQPVPGSALRTQEAFCEWVWEGLRAPRLLLYPPTGNWWVVDDADWEVVIACGPLDLRVCLEPLEDDSLFDWLPKSSIDWPRRSEAEHVAELYGLPLSAGY